MFRQWGKDLQFPAGGRMGEYCPERVEGMPDKTWERGATVAQVAHDGVPGQPEMLADLVHPAG